MGQNVNIAGSQDVQVIQVGGNVVIHEAERPPAKNEKRMLFERALSGTVTVKAKDSSGSGFIVAQDGIIVTNHHVVEDAINEPEEIEVKLPDGKVLKAEVICAFDAIKDLAVLKLETKGLINLPLGDSDRVRVGDDVFTISSPGGFGGYEKTITKGIISNVNREIDGVRCFQFDASVSPGSSGGAFLNSDEEVIGIIAARGHNLQNINFAIPVNVLKHLLIEHGIKFDVLPPTPEKKPIQELLDSLAEKYEKELKEAL